MKFFDWNSEAVFIASFSSRRSLGRRRSGPENAPLLPVSLLERQIYCWSSSRECRSLKTLYKKWKAGSYWDIAKQQLTWKTFPYIRSLSIEKNQFSNKNPYKDLIIYIILWIVLVTPWTLPAAWSPTGQVGPLNWDNETFRIALASVLN